MLDRTEKKSIITRPLKAYWALALWVMWGAIFSVNVPNAHAEQLSFDRVKKGDHTTFDYQWYDVDGNTQHIRFSLPESVTNASLTLQPNYKPTLAQRYVTVALIKKARSYDPTEAIVSINNDNDRIDLEVRSPIPGKADEILTTLKEVQRQAYNDYLEKNYFTQFTTLYQQKAVKPDHIRYVKETTKALVPVSQAFYEKIKRESDARAYFKLLLGWVQSIPYDTLEDRKVSNGSGFAPPLGVLQQNLGDCDSKAVLTSALVRAFLPNTDMAMVFLPDHALLAIALTPMKTDTTITIEGQEYVLYDPTGPALIPFGQVSEDTMRFLDTGRFQIEPIE